MGGPNTRAVGRELMRRERLAFGRGANLPRTGTYEHVGAD